MKRIIIFLILSFFLFPGLCLASDLTRDTQTLLLKVRDTVTHAERELAKKHSVNADFNTLKTLADDLRVNHLLLQDRFETRKQTVNTLGSQAVERHAAMLQQYTQVIEGLLNLIDSLQTTKDLTLDKITKLKTLLENIAPKRPNPIYGALPYRNLNYRYRWVGVISGTTMIPSYLSGDQTVKEEDLASTPSAPISKTIAGKAQELEWNPVLIYEWVKNNVESEWYWGVQKGAEETLRQKSGNDADQACLLVALLRASGYPCRYLYSVIEFFPDYKSATKLTGVMGMDNLLDFFQKAGIASGSDYSQTPPKPPRLMIEHIWVEAQIPYANYRGAVIDTHGKTWLALDTHIKQNGYIENNPAFMPSAIYRHDIRTQYLSQNRVQTSLEYLQDYINTWLTQNQPGINYQDLLQTRTQIPDVQKILPASLQFKTMENGILEFTDIDQFPSLIHKIRFKARDKDNNMLFDATLPAWQLSNQRVALTYEPESVEDQEIINSYGGLDNTPAYLVKLRPVLKINGERIVIGQSGLAMGTEYILDAELSSPNGTERFSNTQIIGNLAVLGIVSQQAVMPREISEQEQDAEYLLHKEVISYIKRWNQAEEELGSLLHLSVIRPIPTMATIGGVVQVDCLLDQPHEFTFKGLYMDANLRAVELATCSWYTDIAGFIEPSGFFMRLSALEGSVLEHKVIEEDFGVECMSTAKLFQIINSQPENLPLVTIDKTNIDTILPTLSLPQNIKEDIANKVNQNLTVLVPQGETSYEDWTGTGYIIEKPITAESGYMLSGMIAGGMTVLRVDRWQYFFQDVLMHPYATAPNPDPNAAFYIMKLAASDLQIGTVGQTLRNPLQVVVLDRNKRPVQGAKVTFKVKAGGGKLGLDTAISGRDGVAQIPFTLGKYTKDNPTYYQHREMEYPQQIGENIVNAWLDNGTELKSPFTAFGYPDAPFAIKKQYGDNQSGDIFSYANFLSVGVEDQYANPLSNSTVTFTALDTTPNSCIPEGETRLSMKLVKPDDPCVKGFPTSEGCGPGLKTLSLRTNIDGCTAPLFFGAVPNATYQVKVTSYNLAEQTFNLKTYRFGNCDGQSEPEWRFYMEYYTPTDAYGNPMTVVKFGGTLTHKVRLHFLKEGSQPGTVKIPCGGCVLCPPTVTCENGIVGNKVYSEYTQFENGSVKLGEFDGKPLGNGIYEVTESLVGTKIGRWEGSMLGKATVKKIHYQECNCTPLMDYPWEVQKLFKIPITFWCVDVKMDPLPSAEVDNEGYLLSDYEIKYRIEPAEYTAMNTQVFIYENDTLIVNLIGDKSGEGKVTLGRGFHVDVNKNYSTEVVLNYGTGSEIRSNKAPLIFNHYDIHGKFKITDAETEMQEDYEPGERVLRNLGGMRIHLEAFMKPPLEVEEYEWSATSGTTFYSSYDTNAGILTGDALKGSNLKEIYWEGNNKVNQEAEIKLKITFKDNSPERVITKKIKTRVLSYLDKGDDVKMLQAFMRMMGISEKDTGYSGTPVTMDGNFTMRAEKALKAFQMADEVSKSGIADDALLARVRIHWVDYKKAVEAYPTTPMNNRYLDFVNWVKDAADYFRNQPYKQNPGDPNKMVLALGAVSIEDLVKAWIDQESALAGQWGYKGIPFRISLGGADEMGSIGFSQICNKWRYGTISSEPLINDFNPYDPEENIKIYRLWAHEKGLRNAFIGAIPPYKKTKNYAWPYFPILVAMNNKPTNNHYEDDDPDCLSKGIMAYNHGHCNYELTWPEMLRAINNPLGQLPYDKRWGVQYALQVKQRAKLALKTWTWKCQRINVGKNKKCDTYIHPWDTPLIAFGSSSSEENQICILPSKNGMLYSSVNRDENGNLVKNSDDVLEEFEFQFSEEEWLSGTTWVQKMLREGAIRN